MGLDSDSDSGQGAAHSPSVVTESDEDDISDEQRRYIDENQDMIQALQIHQRLSRSPDKQWHLDLKTALRQVVHNQAEGLSAAIP